MSFDVRPGYSPLQVAVGVAGIMTAMTIVLTDTSVSLVSTTAIYVSGW